MEKIQREHETILSNREGTETAASPITWKEYKSMTFTHMVRN